MNTAALDPLPAGRVCGRCGGALRFSHLAYVGVGERVAVHACSACGSAYRGAPRPAGTASPAPPRQRHRPGRRPLDEGAPDNPVLDEATARRLRDLLG